MNTPPLAAAIRKENVLFVDGEKADVKTAGKKRKASADLRSTYVPIAGASKDVDLKHKSAMKGNKIKKNQMTRGKRHAAATIRKENVLFVAGEKANVKAAGKKRKASTDLRSTYVPVAGASKDVDLKHKSAMKGNKIKKNQMTRGKRHAAAAIRKEVILFFAGEKATLKTDEEILEFCDWPDHVFTDESDYFMMRKESILQERMRAAAADCTTKKPNHILTDEEILAYECPYHILSDEEIKKIPKSIGDDDREFCMRMESLRREPISKLKPPSLSDEEDCKTDGSDFECFKSVPGSYYTPEELDDPLDKAGMVLEEYTFPELKLYDD